MGGGEGLLEARGSVQAGPPGDLYKGSELTRKLWHHEAGPRV